LNYHKITIGLYNKLNLICLSEAEMAWCSIKNIRIFKRLSTLPDEDGIKDILLKTNKIISMGFE
jgi:hypothetical protein